MVKGLYRKCGLEFYKAEFQFTPDFDAGEIWGRRFLEEDHETGKKVFPIQRRSDLSQIWFWQMKSNRNSTKHKQLLLGSHARKSSHLWRFSNMLLPGPFFDYRYAKYPIEQGGTLSTFPRRSWTVSFSISNFRLIPSKKRNWRYCERHRNLRAGDWIRFSQD